MSTTVPTGYKQTEVGVIPEDWEVHTFGEIFLISAGGDFDPTRTSSIQDAKFAHPVYSNALTLDGLYSYADYADHPANSITVTARGFIGSANYRDHSYTAIGRVLILEPKGKQDGRFFAELINERVQFSIESTGVPQLTAPQISNYRLSVPPLPEQRAIATALSEVDGLIRAQEQLIAKKRDLKQAAMQQLLTAQHRLPGWTGEWAPTQLGTLGKCLRGVSYKPETDLFPHDTDRTIRLFRSNNVQENIVVTNDVQFVNRERCSDQQVMRYDDILICMANGSKALVGKAGIFRIDDSQAYTFGAFMACFRTRADVAHPWFVFSLFQTGRYRDYIANLLAGSSINNLRPSAVESLEFPIPPLPEQTAIAEVLSEQDAELAKLEARLAKTRALKQGMMQSLLTGRVRLV